MDVAFPGLLGKKISELEAIQLLQSKLGQRIIMRTGPIAQPEDVCGILAPLSVQNDLQSRVGTVLDLSLPQEMHDSHIARTQTQIAQDIVQGTLKLPLIFKPNFQQCGQGIAILREHHDQILVSVRLTAIQDAYGAAYLPQALASLGTVYAQGPNHAEFAVERSASIVQRLLEFASVSEMPTNWKGTHYPGMYDPGMLESLLPAITLVDSEGHSHALETRVALQGSLSTGVVYRVGEVRALIGHDEHWANLSLTRKDTGGKYLRADEALTIVALARGDSKKNTQEYVHECLLQSFAWLSKRVLDQGWLLDRKSEFQLDTLWLAQQDQQLAQAAMTEYHLWYGRGAGQGSARKYVRSTASRLH